jgi:hypothetical protein
LDWLLIYEVDDVQEVSDKMMVLVKLSGIRIRDVPGASAALDLDFDARTALISN